MIEFWSVIGRVCLDDGFHRAIFPLVNEGDEFETLEDLRLFLRVQHRLRLSRWEIMTINRAVSRELLPDGSIRVFESVDDDVSVLTIRTGWNSLGVRLPTNPEFYAAVGLACVDLMFREALFNASAPEDQGDVSQLRSLLTNPEGELPAFILSLEEVLVLNRFIRVDGIMRALESFHGQRWVQPTVEPCDGGYTEVAGATYKYFSQPELILMLRNAPELAVVMKQRRALQ